MQTAFNFLKFLLNDIFYPTDTDIFVLLYVKRHIKDTY